MYTRSCSAPQAITYTSISKYSLPYFFSIIIRLSELNNKVLSLMASPKIRSNKGESGGIKVKYIVAIELPSAPR